MRRFVRPALVVAATIFAVWIDLLATSFLANPGDPLPLAGDAAFVRSRWHVPLEAPSLSTEATWTPDESSVGVRPDFSH